MKQLLLFFLFNITCIGVGLAQVPRKGISYQAVVADDLGSVQKDREVTFRISILEGSPTGSAVYAETHKVRTNDKGVASLTIGRGTSLDGSFQKIIWQKGSFFAKIELDLGAGTNFRFMGVSELLSVPYAHYAYEADSANHAGPYYKVGDLAEGGMVIATWDGGRHGWVVALEDESKSVSWERATLLVQGKITGGYRDWQLPNMVQLKLIYEQRGKLPELTAGAYYSNNIESDYDDDQFYEEVLILYFNNPAKNGTEEDARKNVNNDQQESPTFIGARAVRVF